MLLGVPLQVAFEISNYVHVSNYIQKAEQIPDVAVRERLWTLPDHLTCQLHASQAQPDVRLPAASVGEQRGDGEAAMCSGTLVLEDQEVQTGSLQVHRGVAKRGRGPARCAHCRRMRVGFGPPRRPPWLQRRRCTRRWGRSTATWWHPRTWPPWGRCARWPPSRGRRCETASSTTSTSGSTWSHPRRYCRCCRGGGGPPWSAPCWPLSGSLIPELHFR